MISNSQEENDKKLLEMKQLIIDLSEKFKVVSAIEPRLKKYIISIEERFIKLREEINPHEIKTSIQTKAESSMLCKFMEEISFFKNDIIEFQSRASSELKNYNEAFRKIIPIFENLKNTTAARQSNCLACGKITSSPEFEQKTNAELNDTAIIDLQNLGRNFSLIKSKTQLNMSAEFRPRTMERTFNNMKKKVILRANSPSGNILVVAKKRNNESYVGGMAKKAKLPLSYQVMNERHKEGKLGLLQDQI